MINGIIPKKAIRLPVVITSVLTIVRLSEIESTIKRYEKINSAEDFPVVRRTIASRKASTQM